MMPEEESKATSKKLLYADHDPKDPVGKDECTRTARQILERLLKTSLQNGEEQLEASCLFALCWGRQDTVLVPDQLETDWLKLPAAWFLVQNSCPKAALCLIPERPISESFETHFSKLKEKWMGRSLRLLLFSGQLLLIEGRNSLILIEKNTPFMWTVLHVRVFMRNAWQRMALTCSDLLHSVAKVRWYLKKWIGQLRMKREEQVRIFQEALLRVTAFHRNKDYLQAEREALDFANNPGFFLSKDGVSSFKKLSAVNRLNCIMTEYRSKVGKEMKGFFERALSVYFEHDALQGLVLEYHKFNIPHQVPGQHNVCLS